MLNDTIVALATPNIKSALAIIRVSGPNSIETVNKIFSKDITLLDSNTINYGYIIEDNNKVDEVLLSVFRAPKSFTCEDVIEINTHGGIAITRKIIQLVLENGARLAIEGEFTKRAYLNGRIDMLEAEAINDMINATNEYATNIAINGLSKKTSSLIEEFKETLLNVIANIEVNIDYPEYDGVKEYDDQSLYEQLSIFKNDIDQIITSSKTSNIIKNGLNVAIVGSPNAGKSSLLNAFLEQDKAIVSDVKGTTRDVVEASYLLNGIQINFLDTAGIHHTQDTIEKIGIDKSLESIENADLVLLVIDNNKKELDDIEIDLLNNNKKVICVLNKSDLNSTKLVEEGILVSAKNNDLTLLKEVMLQKLDLDLNFASEKMFLSNTRHLALLKNISNSINNSLESLKQHMPYDLIVIDLEEAYDYLNVLQGSKYEETLLERMFSQFCLGK